MNALVVYQSKYGSTKQYAEWIGKELGATVKRMTEVTDDDLRSHDVIVFGSYLHIGKIVDIDFLTRFWPTLSTKKLFLYTVSGAGPSPAEQKFYEDNVAPEMRERITHFGLAGRATNLDWKDTLLMAFPRGSALFNYLSKRTPENWAAYEHFKSFDAVKRENIAPLVVAIKAVG